MILNTGLKSLLGDLGQFAKLPISPYPKIENCLGIQGKSAIMNIDEGFVNIGYEYKVK